MHIQQYCFKYIPFRWFRKCPVLTLHNIYIYKYVRVCVHFKRPYMHTLSVDYRTDLSTVNFVFFRPNLNLTVLDTKRKMPTETSSSGKKTAMPAELRKDPTDTPTLTEFTGLLSTLLTNMDSEHG